MAEPPDRFGVDGPSCQQLECVFATFKGVIDPNVADPLEGEAGEPAVEPKRGVGWEFTVATSRARAIGTSNRNLTDGGYSGP